MANGFEGAIKGFEAGQQVALRAVDLARKQQEMEQSQQANKIAKYDAIFNSISKVVSTPKGKGREFLKKRSQNLILESALPVDPQIIDTLDDDDMFIPVTKNLAYIAGIQDPDKKAALIDSSAPFMENMDKFRQGSIQMAAQLENQQAVQRAKQQEIGVSAGKEETDRLSSLLKDWSGSPRTKRTQEMEESLGRVTAAAGGSEKFAPDVANEIRKFGLNPSKTTAFGDLVLIFNFMKMLDPGSVVRESEFEVAATTGGVAQRAAALMNKALKGERLTPEQRAELLGESQKVISAQRIQQAMLDKQTFNQAKALGVSLDRLSLGMGRELSPNQSKFEKAMKALEAKGINRSGLMERINQQKNLRKQELKGKKGK